MLSETEELSNFPCMFLTFQIKYVLLLIFKDSESSCVDLFSTRPWLIGYTYKVVFGILGMEQKMYSCVG